jgi:hypothetical protein
MNFSVEAKVNQNCLLKSKKHAKRTARTKMPMNFSALREVSNYQ